MGGQEAAGDGATARSVKKMLQLSNIGNAKKWKPFG